MRVFVQPEGKKFALFIEREGRWLRLKDFESATAAHTVRREIEAGSFKSDVLQYLIDEALRNDVRLDPNGRHGSRFRQ